jgi:TPP-dependent pyruvate/acetoin dehydrogenase alpha subunit
VVVPDGVEGSADPIARLGAWLASEKVLDAKAAAAMRADVEAEIRAAVAGEESIGPPPSSALIEHVLVRPSAALEEQLAALEQARRR